MIFNFPTVCTQSVSVACGHGSPPVMVEFEADVPTGMVDSRDQKITRRKVVGTRWVAFAEAIQMLMLHNKATGVTNDPRLDP